MGSAVLYQSHLFWKLEGDQSKRAVRCGIHRLENLRLEQIRSSSRNHISLTTAFVNSCHLYVRTCIYLAKENIPSCCLLLHVNLKCLKPVSIKLLPLWL